MAQKVYSFAYCRLDNLKKEEEQLQQELKDVKKKLEDTAEAIAVTERDLTPL